MTLPRIGALLLVAACVLLVSWLARTPPLSVDVATVRRAELVLRISTNGKIEPVDVAEVRARLDGRITYLPDPGTRVEQGGVLLRIDAAVVSAELAQAESERLSAHESLAVAMHELTRVARRAASDRELFARGGVTPERNRESQADLAAARARVEFLERDVPFRVSALDLRIEELTAQRDNAELRALVSGTLYDTDAKLGETVQMGDLVLWFADLAKLRVRTNIDQVDLGAVSIGQPLRITSNAYPGRVWSARVSELIPHIVRKQARLVAEGLANIDPPAEGLVPGMTVDVELAVDSGPSVLQVPAEAVFSDAEGSYVLRIEDDRVAKLRVSIGRGSAAMLEISRGLAEGDRVVIGPVSVELGDRDRVRVRSRDDG